MFLMQRSYAVISRSRLAVDHLELSVGKTKGRAKNKVQDAALQDTVKDMINGTVSTASAEDGDGFSSPVS